MYYVEWLMYYDNKINLMRFRGYITIFFVKRQIERNVIKLLLKIKQL